MSPCWTASVPATARGSSASMIVVVRRLLSAGGGLARLRHRCGLIRGVVVAVGRGLVGVGGGLQCEQLRVHAGGRNELVVAAVFDDPAAADDVDVVDVAHGVVPVR